MSEFDPKAYWENRLSVQFNLKGAGYYQMGEQYNRWMYRVRKSVFMALLRRYAENATHASVLDIGSGTGFYIDLWESSGARSITGIDITQTVIDQLRRRFADYTFIEMDISDQLDTLDGHQFDYVSAFDILFHITDDHRLTQAVANIYQLVKPGGYFFFSDVFLHRATQRSTHYVARSLAEIEKQLAQAGFEIVERRPFLMWMNAPIDSDSRWLHTYWKLLRQIVKRSELLGYLIGACQYPIETLAVRLMKESPTSEIMICRRPE
jgi:SAM-dependent methyltransferase